jgi:hypothetical protein
MDWCIYITTKTKMARCHIMDGNTIMIKLFLLKKSSKHVIGVRLFFTWKTFTI